MERDNLILDTNSSLVSRRARVGRCLALSRNRTLSIFTSLAEFSLCCLSHSPTSKTSPIKQTNLRPFRTPNFFLLRSNPAPKRCRLRSPLAFFNTGNESKPKFQGQDKGSDLAILKRWDVPWQLQTVFLTSLACGLSFIFTGLVETAAIPFLGLKIEELSLDEKAEILFLDQSITTLVVLGVMYGIINTFQPLPEDVFRYDLRELFNLQKGWLLWAGIGLAGALLAIALTGVAMSAFSGETPQRETDALVRLLPLIGSSTISTACLVGITGVLAPVLEETLFRGFFMVSLTKWVPPPVSVIISAAVFALAHLTPGKFPQLFVLGTALGFSYAHTRNLLTPIAIHAFWNSGVILILSLLQLQGYDIK